MKPIIALTKARPRNRTIQFGGGDGSFTQEPFWSALSSLGERERITEDDFASYVEGAYKSSGIVFACVLARMAVFSQARLQYQRISGGRPSDLFGDQSLRLLERPWANGTTAELLARMEQDISLAGNFYATTVGTGANRRIRRLRPDWVTVLTVSPTREDGTPGSPYDLGAEVGGYIYRPGGRVDGAVVLDPSEVVHWSPIPDPQAQWRGMSWITPVLREIEGDTAATKHKLRFFENGAVSNLVISYDPSVSQEDFDAAVAAFADQHAGVDKAYKTIHLGGGADAKVVGADLKQLDFKVTQGAGETRIAAASGVGAIIGQFSEGMQGSSLNAGNYGSARRRFSDVTMQHLWQSAAPALEALVSPPDGARLTFDTRDVPFLQEDAKDEAEIRQINAATMRQLVDGGFEPESIKQYVASGDPAVLKHTGRTSVQLHLPGDTDEPDDAGEE